MHSHFTRVLFPLCCFGSAQTDKTKKQHLLATSVCFVQIFTILFRSQCSSSFNVLGNRDWGSTPSMGASKRRIKWSLFWLKSMRQCYVCLYLLGSYSHFCGLARRVACAKWTYCFWGGTKWSGWGTKWVKQFFIAWGCSWKFSVSRRSHWTDSVPPTTPCGWL